MSDSAILSAADYRTRIDNLIERGRYQQASAELAQAFASYPEDADLLHQAAQLECFAEKPLEARATLLQLLSRDPEHVAGRFLLVGVHEELKEPAKAEEVLLGLLHDYPESSGLYARYATLMYRNMKIDKARELAREALRLDPDDDSALMACLIGDLISGDGGAQQDKLGELLRRNPEDQTTARLLIVHLVEHGKYWSARRIAVELFKADPHSKDTLELLVSIEALAHWTMVPLWAFNRWGAKASVGFFLIALFGLAKLREHIDSSAMGVINIALIGYVIYSWVYPPLLSRWLKRRAGL